MKVRFKVLVMWIAIVVTSFVGFAEPTSSGTPTIGDAVLIPIKSGSRNKRIPSKNHLELSYHDGVLTLTSESFAGEFSLEINNSITGESNVVPSILVGESITIDLIPDQYEVTATSTDGQTFCGYLDVYGIN